MAVSVRMGGVGRGTARRGGWGQSGKGREPAPVDVGTLAVVLHKTPAPLPAEVSMAVGVDSKLLLVAGDASAGSAAAVAADAAAAAVPARDEGGGAAPGTAVFSACFLFLAFFNRCFSALSLCSAASALLMFSCFFHLVRRFWNQIFTCKPEKMFA